MVGKGRMETVRAGETVGRSEWLPKAQVFWAESTVTTTMTTTTTTREGVHSGKERAPGSSGRASS